MISWRITLEDGSVTTGFCGEEARRVIYYTPVTFYDSLTADPPDEFASPSFYDCRALKATWPIYEAMRKANEDPDYDAAWVREMSLLRYKPADS